MSDIELGAGKTCFIVGPIGDKLEPPGSEGLQRYENAIQVWENVFQPACAIFGIEPVRADKISEAGDITEQIFTYLRDAEIVIADLTGGNANVMYELGLRHTRNMITLQIGEHEHLPFDVTTIRTIKFKRSEAGLIDARNSLTDALRVALNGEGGLVTATRVWGELDKALDPQVVSAQSALSYSGDQPADKASDEDLALGRLDRLARGEAAMMDLGLTLGAVTASMSSLGNIALANTPAMGGANSFAKQLTTLRLFVSEIEPVATEFDNTASDYLSRVREVDSMIAIFAADFADDPTQLSDPDLQEFLGSIVALSRMTAEQAISLMENLQYARDMRKWSKIAVPVSKKLEHAYVTVLSGNEVITGWADRFRALPGWVEPPEVHFDADDDDGDLGD